MKRASLEIAISLSPYSKAIASPLNHNEMENDRPNQRKDFPEKGTYLIVERLSGTPIRLYNAIDFTNNLSVMEIVGDYRCISEKEVEELQKIKYSYETLNIWIPVTEEVVHHLFQVKK